MNKVLPWITVGVVGVGVGFLLRGAQSPARQISPEQARAQLLQAATTPAEGKIVHTFPDEEAMRAFVTLWQQRQERLLRMGMLEGYWNNDQATLNQLNTQLSSQYHLDLAKSHVLDPDRRELVEQEIPAAPEAGASPSAEAPASPETAQAAPAGKTSEEKRVVHTFADEDAMKAFADLWQQRQSVIVRMAVLKAYWDSEQGLVGQLNTQLAADYQVDVAKAYALDDQRRVLIERPAPPAPPAAASTPPAGPEPAQPADSQPAAQPPAPSPASAGPSQTGQ